MKFKTIIAKPAVSLPNVDYVLIVKVVLFVFVLVSPFINFSYLHFMDYLLVKVALLACIIALCFVDFQLALIATIAFLILIVNLDSNLVKMFRTQKNETDAKSVIKSPQQVDTYINSYADFTPNEKNETVMSNIACQNELRNDINDDMLTYFIDDKIKPYEIYVKMMVSSEHVDKAQGVFI